MMKNLKAQDKVCQNLSDAVDKLSPRASSSNLRDKREKMIDMMRSAQANGKEKEAALHENLRQV